MCLCGKQTSNTPNEDSTKRPKQAEAKRQRRAEIRAAAGNGDTDALQKLRTEADRKAAERKRKREEDASTNKTAWLSLGRDGGGEFCGGIHTEQQCYVKALEIDRQCNECWFLLGTVGGGCVGGQEQDEAQCYANALQIDASDASAWFLLGCEGGGCIGGDGHNEAQCFVKALTINKSDYEAWLQLGCAGGGLVFGEQKSASDCFEVAIRSPDTYVKIEARVRLGIACDGEGDLADPALAQQSFLDALACQPRGDNIDEQLEWHCEAWTRLSQWRRRRADCTEDDFLYRPVSVDYSGTEFYFDLRPGDQVVYSERPKEIYILTRLYDVNGLGDISSISKTTVHSHYRSIGVRAHFELVASKHTCTKGVTSRNTRDYQKLVPVNTAPLRPLIAVPKELSHPRKHTEHNPCKMRNLELGWWKERPKQNKQKVVVLSPKDKDKGKRTIFERFWCDECNGTGYVDWRSTTPLHGWCESSRDRLYDARVSKGDPGARECADCDRECKGMLMCCDERLHTREECFAKALEASPHDNSAWFGLGLCGGGFAVGKKHSQCECYAQALENSWSSDGYEPPLSLFYPHDLIKHDFELHVPKVESNLAETWLALALAGGGRVAGKHHAAWQCCINALECGSQGWISAWRAWCMLGANSQQSRVGTPHANPNIGPSHQCEIANVHGEEHTHEQCFAKSTECMPSEVARITGYARTNGIIPVPGGLMEASILNAQKLTFGSKRESKERAPAALVKSQFNSCLAEYTVTGPNLYI